MKLKSFQASLQDLALKIENEWSLQNFSNDLFPDIAFENLSQFQEIPTFDPGSLLEDIQDIDLPLQSFPNKEFSDFPLTLIRREKFLVDMYIWIRSDTSIHNHHFSGAFKVIAGSSFQVSYEFFSHKTLGENLEEGGIQKLDEVNLPKGSVQKILYQDKFIHQVLHLEQPTITLCVRTPPSEKNALAVYLYPKYRLLMKNLSLSKSKWIEALNVILSTGKESVKYIPLSDCEILRLIYQNHLRPGFLSPNVLSFFERYLASKDFAQEFIKLMKKQSKLSNKLKMFAFISGNDWENKT